MCAGIFGIGRINIAVQADGIVEIVVFFKITCIHIYSVIFITPFQTNKFCYYSYIQSVSVFKLFLIVNCKTVGIQGGFISLERVKYRTYALPGIVIGIKLFSFIGKFFVFDGLVKI